MDLFSKKWVIASALAMLVFGQLVYSFLYPSVGLSENWQPISSYLSKFAIEGSDNFILLRGLAIISSNYRLNSDVGHYLELARNFSIHDFEGSPFLERPLYPFLIFLASLPVRIFAPASYGVIFASSMIVNLILIYAAVILFFFFTQKLFSGSIAWLSSILLIFSPFTHSYINQPLAEMLMAFSVMAAIFLFYHYIKKPSLAKLIIFSLIIGVFMLGKMFFAISFFILLFALYYRRFKEGAVFAVIHLMPFVFWYLWVTKIWGIAYSSHQMNDWDMGVWIFRIFSMPWHQNYEIFISTLPNFINAFIYAFLLIPVIFSLIGLRLWQFPAKNIIYTFALLSVFGLGFLAKFFYIRHVFLLFPIVLPTAVLGMQVTASQLKKKAEFLAPVFWVVIFGAMVLLGNLDIYQVFNYNH